MSDHRKPYLPLAFGRMPGWAISFSVALVATCIAIIAMASVYAQARAHRAEEYKTCVARNQSTVQIIDVFGRLRDADQAIVDVTSTSPVPATPASRALIVSAQKRVTAYDELLTLAAKGQKVDCSTLK